MIFAIFLCDPAEFENSDLFVAYQSRFVSTVDAGFSGEMDIWCAKQASVGRRDLSW